MTDVNLVAEAGSTVALVGRSGAGKTTLCNLVARFFDPTEGRVTLDGTDLRDFDVEKYRTLLGVVEQDVFLFDGTVADNIAYARPDATSWQEIEAAAEAANAAEFIVKMPDGLNTFIGERGVKLSGGQRQRLAIARAILADPKILILDEATSNLDTESERLIQTALAELMEGRTSFVIAHRLSTIRDADSNRGAGRRPHHRNRRPRRPHAQRRPLRRHGRVADRRARRGAGMSLVRVSHCVEQPVVFVVRPDPEPDHACAVFDSERAIVDPDAGGIDWSTRPDSFELESGVLRVRREPSVRIPPAGGPTAAVVDRRSRTAASRLKARRLPVSRGGRIEFPIDFVERGDVQRFRSALPADFEGLVSQLGEQLVGGRGRERFVPSPVGVKFGEQPACERVLPLFRQSGRTIEGFGEQLRHRLPA